MGSPEDNSDVLRVVDHDEQLLATKLDDAAAIANASPQDENMNNEIDTAIATAAATAQLESDAALAAAIDSMAANDVHDDPVFVSCQICMDALLVDEVVTQLCGVTCAAQICTACLVQHVIASVYSYYPGVLPKVRCPICLTLVGKREWERFVKPAPTEEPAPTQTEEPVTPAPAQEPAPVPTEEPVTLVPTDTLQSEAEPEPTSLSAAATERTATSKPIDYTHVLDKYAMLCHQSLEFQSPCCDNPEYTMLLPARPVAAAVELRALLTSIEQSDSIQPLEALCETFAAHLTTAQTLHAFVFESFSSHADTVLSLVLETLVDEERRATLLLYELFIHPDVYTHCCSEAVCFKCKATSHHDGDCNDFVQDDCVLQCSGCHVTLVKVDGCDAVTCLCGQSIHWPSEIAKQRSQRKMLAPTDEHVFRCWHVWKLQNDRMSSQIYAIDVTMRDIRLKQFVRMHRAQLRRVVMRYMAVKRKAVEAEAARVAQEATAVTAQADAVEDSDEQLKHMPALEGVEQAVADVTIAPPAAA